MDRKKRIIKRAIVLILAALVILPLFGCGKDEPKAPVADGVYTVTVKTDSSMFHINEAHNGKGTLTVKDGRMTVHITLASKKITRLFFGKAEDAKKDGAKLIEPTVDSVTYSDGITEEAYGFDVPVPYLNDPFDCAILGSKDNWYDHKVTVSDPEPLK
ncbi:MAG: hypothetical protein IJM80_04335 [Firmicutes bacterium]|nr:hypothetical protein [Bacillota bacterium]